MSLLILRNIIYNNISFATDINKSNTIIKACFDILVTSWNLGKNGVWQP